MTAYIQFHRCSLLAWWCHHCEASAPFMCSIQPRTFSERSFLIKVDGGAWVEFVLFLLWGLLITKIRAHIHGHCFSENNAFQKQLSKFLWPQWSSVDGSAVAALDLPCAVSLYAACLSSLYLNCKRKRSNKAFSCQILHFLFQLMHLGSAVHQCKLLPLKRTLSTWTLNFS